MICKVKNEGAGSNVQKSHRHDGSGGSKDFSSRLTSFADGVSFDAGMVLEVATGSVGV